MTMNSGNCSVSETASSGLYLLPRVLVTARSLIFLFKDNYNIYLENTSKVITFEKKKYTFDYGAKLSGFI